MSKRESRLTQLGSATSAANSNSWRSVSLASKNAKTKPKLGSPIFAAVKRSSQLLPSGDDQCPRKDMNKWMQNGRTRVLAARPVLGFAAGHEPDQQTLRVTGPYTTFVFTGPIYKFAFMNGANVLEQRPEIGTRLFALPPHADNLCQMYGDSENGNPLRLMLYTDPENLIPTFCAESTLRECMPPLQYISSQYWLETVRASVNLALRDIMDLFSSQNQDKPVAIGTTGLMVSFNPDRNVNIISTLFQCAREYVVRQDDGQLEVTDTLQPRAGAFRLAMCHPDYGVVNVARQEGEDDLTFAIRLLTDLLNEKMRLTNYGKADLMPVDETVLLEIRQYAVCILVSHFGKSTTNPCDRRIAPADIVQWLVNPAIKQALLANKKAEGLLVGTIVSFNNESSDPVILTAESRY